MIKKLRRILIVTVSIAASLIAAPSWASPYSALVVFGDSLADSGNNALVFDTFGPPPGTLRSPAPIPSGTFIPAYPYASNRYSNGPVWTEYFAASLGLSAQPSLAGGTNFAFGGARVSPAGSPFPYSLMDQVSGFILGNSGSVPASALYVVEGGGNDARNAIQIFFGGGNPSAIIGSYVSGIATIIGQLMTAGAQDILLWNIPDVGKTPAIQAFGPTAAAAASGLVMTMNAALEAMLDDLSPSLLAGVHLFDAFDAINDVFANPAAYGMTDVASACGFSPACIANPSTTLFWDGIHPTTAGHALLARAALAEIPEPSAFLLFALALALLAFNGRHMPMNRTVAVIRKRR